MLKKGALRGATFAAIGFALPAISLTALAEPYKEIPVFASKNGLLNIIMIAEADPNPAFKRFYPGSQSQGPESWVYRICRDQPANAMTCPAESSLALLSGVRLAIRPGDTLKVRLVNRLPKRTDFKNAALLGDNLLLNPTDLHLHGSIVEPRVPTLNRQSYGDTIFVLAYNSANGMPAANDPHSHVDIRSDYVDYEYNFPANHPAGTYIYHPHPHGVSANQMEAGLSGIYTIGDVSDRACDDAHCTRPLSGVATRYLLLKDTQIEAGADGKGQLVTQIDSGFCDPNSPKDGYCEGVDNTSGGGSNHTGGKWFFPVSGQVYPSIEIESPKGEIWSFANASANRTYDLRLTENSRDMAMQVIAVDGISLDTPISALPGDVVRMSGGKIHVANCPKPNGAISQIPVCADSITMFPSSRVDVWVTYRDANGNAVTPHGGAGAILRTAEITTGSSGDSWPAINLAHVEFEQHEIANAYINLRSGKLFGPGGIFSTVGQPSTKTERTGACDPLPAGYHRRVYYGIPANSQFNFGLGYEVVDDKGNVVPGSTVDITPFDPNTPIICLPLGAGNTPVTEVWELVNLATEAHNFHIHQTKFRVVDMNAKPSSPLFTTAMSARKTGGAAEAIFNDNISLPPASDGCSTIADYRNGACTVSPVVVEIPFKWAGDYVYHCHILEHEDGGMMAKIRVATNP